MLGKTYGDIALPGIMRRRRAVERAHRKHCSATAVNGPAADRRAPTVASAAGAPGSTRQPGEQRMNPPGAEGRVAIPGAARAVGRP